MTSVGIRTLKQNASKVVADVAKGDSVIITDRGRAVAQLNPISTDVIGTLVQEGRARLPKRSLGDLTPPPARRRGHPPLTEVLETMRGDERY